MTQHGTVSSLLLVRNRSKKKFTPGSPTLERMFIFKSMKVFPRK